MRHISLNLLRKEERYISQNVCLYVCGSLSVSERIVQFWLQTSISQQLIIWLSWNLAYLSTLGCRLWYWCLNSCQQLSLAVNSCFFYHDRRKSTLEASYAKVCLAKCSGNWLEMNFEYWNFSVAQKLTELRFFFFFSCQ